MKINYFLLILFVFATVFNFGFAVYGRLRLDRKYQNLLLEYNTKLHDSVVAMSDSALKQIDQHYQLINSNLLDRVSNTTNSISQLSPENTILKVQGSVKYHYFIYDHQPYCYMGSCYYTLGDYFPLGGILTHIDGEYLVLDGTKLLQRDSSPIFSSSSFVSSESTKNQLERLVQNAKH